MLHAYQVGNNFIPAMSWETCLIISVLQVSSLTKHVIAICILSHVINWRWCLLEVTPIRVLFGDIQRQIWDFYPVLSVSVHISHSGFMISIGRIVCALWIMIGYVVWVLSQGLLHGYQYVTFSIRTWTVHVGTFVTISRTLNSSLLVWSPAPVWQSPL